MEVNDTKEIQLIKTNPEKAIKKLSAPIILSLIFMMLNNLINSAWVSGLGTDALAAVGFVTPLFIALVGLGNGIGAGANSAIARFIGADNKEKANNAVMHSIVLAIILTICLTLILSIFLDNVLLALGAKDVLDLARQYALVIVLGLYSFMIPTILGAILRSEGHVKQATYPLIASAILNMMIDPIFIYILNMGVAGAAVGTIISQTCLGIIPMAYWLITNKNNYLTIKIKNYKNDLAIYKDILSVGIPASLEEIIMGVLSGIMNIILSIVSGTAAVAVFSATWRLVSVAITPALGIGIASVTIIGTAFGAKNKANIKKGYMKAIELSALISIVIFAIFYIFSGSLAELFTYSNPILAQDISNAIRILGIYIIFVPFGLVAAYYFQGIGKGFISLILTVLREFVFLLLFVTLFAFILNWGSDGVYWGIVVGGIIGSFIPYIYAKYHMEKAIL